MHLVFLFDLRLQCGPVIAERTRRKRSFDRPADMLLLLLWTAWASGVAASVANSSTSTTWLLPNGTGSAYASQCQSTQLFFSSAASTWSERHKRLNIQTFHFGGTQTSSVTYYKDASTLCDGHPRVAHQSPATPISSTVIEYYDGAPSSTVSTETDYPYYHEPRPTCSIAPDDCDPLWSAYTASMSSWAKEPQITPPPFTPPCTNISAAASYSSALESVRGCGPCTLYGDHVQLLFFPTTASRDMCASIPTASITYFNTDELALDVYAGKSYGKPSQPGAVTAVVGGHTFTSGTAYISIGKVWASDRCSSLIGTTISDAIIALKSESVLSLRYSQDQTQFFLESTTQTGYPVSYADFNKPIPWSAWNGQGQCGGPCPGCGCDVIYENQYNPQLAMPPGIRQLDARWKKCQNYYWGLYDPPMVLQPASTFDMPTTSPLATAAGTKIAMSAMPASPSIVHAQPTATSLPKDGTPSTTSSGAVSQADTNVKNIASKIDQFLQAQTPKATVSAGPRRFAFPAQISDDTLSVTDDADAPEGQIAIAVGQAAASDGSTVPLAHGPVVVTRKTTANTAASSAAGLNAPSQASPTPDQDASQTTSSNGQATGPGTTPTGSVEQSSGIEAASMSTGVSHGPESASGTTSPVMTASASSNGVSAAIQAGPSPTTTSSKTGEASHRRILSSTWIAELVALYLVSWCFTS